MNKDVQPRVADSSVPFRVTASGFPFVRDSAGFSHVLPAARGGANAVVELDVVLLGGLFSKSSRFFDGICQVPQADEDALFKHPVTESATALIATISVRRYSKIAFNAFAVQICMFTIPPFLCSVNTYLTRLI